MVHFLGREGRWSCSDTFQIYVAYGAFRICHTKPTLAFTRCWKGLCYMLCNTVVLRHTQWLVKHRWCKLWSVSTVFPHFCEKSSLAFSCSKDPCTWPTNFKETALRNDRPCRHFSVEFDGGSPRRKVEQGMVKQTVEIAPKHSAANNATGNKSMVPDMKNSRLPAEWSWFRPDILDLLRQAA